jgi:hypothetical protein
MVLDIAPIHPRHAAINLSNTCINANTFNTGHHALITVLYTWAISASFPKHKSERDRFDLVPSACCFSGASISPKDFVLFLRCGQKWSAKAEYACGLWPHKTLYNGSFSGPGGYLQLNLPQPCCCERAASPRDDRKCAS